MDLDWCLHCERKTQDGSSFCSVGCEDLYRQPDHHDVRASSSSRLSSSSSSDLSDLQLSSPAPPPQYEGDLHTQDWAGKGSSGVPAWAAQIPPGAPPQSYASSPLSPPSLRPRKSTSSTRSTASSHASPAKGQPVASSSTLRPSLPPSLAVRKPAPPRLFLHSSSPSHHPTCRSHSSHASSVCSPFTTSCTVLPHDAPAGPPPAASPTQPILNNRTSIPSLTAQSATASLSSLATPHTASRPSSRPSSFHPCGSRPGSHPASAAVSVAGDEDGEDDESEGTPESRPVRRTWYQTAMTRVSTGVRQWAAGERAAGHLPYSTTHMVAVPRSAVRAPARGGEDEEREEREKTMTRAPPPPAASAQQHRPSAPIPKPQTRHARAYKAASPVPFFPLQDEFVRPSAEHFEATQKVRPPPQAVRMGRALVYPRVASRAHLSAYFQQPQTTSVPEHPAWAARGRRPVKQERQFASPADDDR